MAAIALHQNYSLALGNNPRLHYSKPTSKNYPSHYFTVKVYHPPQGAVQPIQKPMVQLNAPQNKEPLSPMMADSAHVINGISEHIQGSFEMADMIFGLENPASLKALGFTASLNMLTGGLNIYDGVNEIKTAEKVSDVYGKNLGILKTARGSVAAANGALDIPVRALSFSAATTASKTLSAVGGVLGKISASFSTLLSILNLAHFSMKIHEQRLFREEFVKLLDNPEQAFAYLKSLVTVTDEEKAQLPAADKEKAIEELLGRKQAHVRRVLSNTCLQLISSKGVNGVKEVVEAARKASLENAVIDGLAVGLSVVGVALFICTLIFTSAFAVLAMSAVGLGLTTAWLAIDGYALIQDFINGDPGRYDKLCIFVSTVLTVAIVATVFFLSSGIVPLIVAGVFGVTWFAINGVCLWRLRQQELQSLSTNP